MREQSHYKNQDLEAEARKPSSGIRTHLFKSGPLTTWTALRGTVGFPACLRTAFPGGISTSLGCALETAGALQWPVEHRGSGMMAPITSAEM